MAAIANALSSVTNTLLSARNIILSNPLSSNVKKTALVAATAFLIIGIGQGFEETTIKTSCEYDLLETANGDFLDVELKTGWGCENSICHQTFVFAQFSDAKNLAVKATMIFMDWCNCLVENDLVQTCFAELEEDRVTFIQLLK